MAIHIMLDLETLGVGLTPATIQIAAVPFHPFKDLSHLPSFNCYISKKANIDAGLIVDSQTEEWWSKQSDAAKQVLTLAEESTLTMKEAITQFTGYLNSIRKMDETNLLRIWGNGSVFDNRIILAICSVMGEKQPWKYNEDRDLRTLFEVASGLTGFDPKSVPFEGTQHVAIDDAKYQIRQAREAFSSLGGYILSKEG